MGRIYTKIGIIKIGVSMNYVFINERHKLLPEQEAILDESIEGYNIIKIPSEGWDSCQIVDKIEELNVQNDEGTRFIFVSPIPLMIALSVKNDIIVGIMHNDRREKKEINGKIISVVAQTGWELIWV